MKFSKALAAAVAFSATAVSALPAVTRSGRYLYANGARFFIKGIAYQEQGTVTSNDPTGFPEPTDFVDPLADAKGCARDVPYLQQLGVNTVRVYSVNSALDHSACMKALSAANIYVILDLALPVNGSIDRISPAWTTNLLDLYTGTISTFLQYDNVLGFNIGNEVVTDVASTAAGPFIRAAARDVKAYLASKGSSALVGFASTDGDSSWRLALADYLACDSAATDIDLYGLNVYRWCGDASITAYSSIITDYANYPIPAYFSEFGCVTSPPRLWTEVAALFGPQMTPAWSGGMAFSYFPAVGGYGMVNISTDGTTVTTSGDFDRLKTQYAAVTFATTPAQADAGANTQATCPTPGAAFLASNTLPPTPVNTACNCLTTSAITCKYTNSGSANSPVIIGDLLNYACSALGTMGGTCDPIGASGTAGTYGAFSVCDPATKLSYVLTQFYELSNRAAGSCDFSGNATAVTTGPTNAAAAQAAISSCAAQAFTGTTIPAQPSSTSPSNNGAATGAAGSSASGSSSSGGSNASGAVGMRDVQGLASVLVVAVVGIVAGGMAVLV